MFILGVNQWVSLYPVWTMEGGVDPPGKKTTSFKKAQKAFTPLPITDLKPFN